MKSKTWTELKPLLKKKKNIILGYRKKAQESYFPTVQAVMPQDIIN